MNLRSFHLILIIGCFSFGTAKAQVAAPEFLCIAKDTLIWNTPTNTCGAFNSYLVFGSRNIDGPYSVIATITGQNEDRFWHQEAAGTPWFYYLQSDYDCPGEAVLTSDTISNQIPERSPISFVSVEGEDVVIEWEESPSPEVFAYVILKETATGTPDIDTVFNGNTYTDTNANPTARTERYFVVAMDPCGNRSLVPQEHTTMLLTVENIDSCNQSVTMSWNEYIGWDQNGGIGSHEIWSSVNGGPFILVDEVSGEATTYTYEDADDGNTYCFYVRAVQADDPAVFSNSSRVCETLDIVQPVRNFVLKNATINADSTVTISWRWNANAELDAYNLNFSRDNLSFEAIASGNPMPPLDVDNQFIQSDIGSIDGPLYYQVTTLDACGKEDSTAVVATIFLSGASGSNTTNQLQWTPYNNPNTQVSNYEIHRIIDGKDELIDIINGNVTEFADILSQDLLNQGAACYYVVAVADLFISSGQQEVVRSRSNVICLEQEAQVYVPNAFIPDGVLNQQFKPVLQFGNPQEYLLVIFDRWGQQVFESNSVDFGWDGKMDNKPLPQGVYAYYIKVIQGEGNLTEKKGTVLLIR